MATMSNPRELRAAIEAEGEGLLGALTDELARLAQEAVRLLKNRAPKWRTALTNSMHAERESPFEWHVGPGMEYAQAVEEGVKPGKGLPRWSDPAAADIKAWLGSKVFAGKRRSKDGRRGMRQNLELRYRYQGLAWHVRRFGVKARPYMQPMVEQMARIFAPRLKQAGRNYMAGAGSRGAA